MDLESTMVNYFTFLRCDMASGFIKKIIKISNGICHMDGDTLFLVPI